MTELESDTNRSVDLESKSDKKRLFDDRDVSDKAFQKERYRVDRAIGGGGEIKRDLVEGLLAQERAQTDQILAEERDRTDTEVQRVTGLLSDEVALHLKTRAALTTRDEFLAIVSHDLRNPIGAVFSCAEMLLEDYLPKGNGRENKYWIELIKRKAAAALHLIDDILDIERIAEGKLRLRFGPNSIPQLIRESVESFVFVASAKNILLRAKLLENIGSAVCDRDRIMQVLSNVIGNALKFTPEGGSVVLDAHYERDNVLISISDTGPGIPEDRKEFIFERFAQVGLADSRGLGLGLYISKMLIEAHQGQIWVQSDFGKGSTFWISIPKHGPVEIRKSAKST